MSDYINREAVKAGMIRYGFTASDMTVTEFVEDELPAANVEPVRRWIPCSERLPDLIPCKAGTAYSEKGIVWTTGRKAMVCVWDGKDWFVPYGFWEVWGKDVTHWMPLPEPPEEGGTEK